MPFDVFEGGAVQNAYIGYVNYTQTATPGVGNPDPFLGTNNLGLIWSNTYQPGLSWNIPLDTSVGNPVVVAFMDIVVIGTGRTVTLPNAMNAPIGTNFIISNRSGQTTYTIDIYLNGALTPKQTAAQNISYYFLLTDNSTAEGVWDVIVFGSGAAPIVTGLVGFGLTGPYAPAGQQNQINASYNISQPVPQLGEQYTIQLSDWGKYLVVGNAVANLKLPIHTTIPAGYYFYISNQSTNAGDNLPIVVQGGDSAQINNGSYTEVPYQSSIGFVYTGIQSAGNFQWYTIQTPQIQFPVTILQGGTGQSAKEPAFDALAPTTTAGEMIYYSGSLVKNTLLAPPLKTGTALTYQVDTANQPRWVGLSAIQIQKKVVNSGGASFTNTAPLAVPDPDFNVPITATYANSQFWIQLTLTITTSVVGYFFLTRSTGNAPVVTVPIAYNTDDPLPNVASGYSPARPGINDGVTMSFSFLDDLPTLTAGQEITYGLNYYLSAAGTGEINGIGINKGVSSLYVTEIGGM